jgi:two-component system sensor kinase ParS
MQRLYMQIAGGVMLAAAVGWTAVALFLPQMRTLMEQSLGDQLLGSGLRAVGTRLDAIAPDAWAAELAVAQREITIPLTIVARDRLPEGVTIPGDHPTVTHPGGASRASIYIPLRAGTHFLVAGPLQEPPVAPLATVAVVFVLVLTVTASAFVGVPLVRRLRTVRNALADLGGGNWATRLDANAEGALRELAESVNQMAAQLQQQFEERESLLQAVSHEMGTPLSRMRFRLEMLEESGINPDQRKRLAALADDLNALDDLSSELVGWMESDGSPQPWTTFDPRPVIDSLLELECHTAGRSLRAVVDGPAAGMTIHADQRQFQRAMENLLRNAVRYASLHIAVTIAADSDTVVVDIRDDGPGIPPDQRVRVLQPFVRGDARHSAVHHRGLGLGLAIVHRILASHGGHVEIGQSAEGGASVRTVWPRVAVRLTGT